MSVQTQAGSDQRGARTLRLLEQAQTAEGEERRRFEEEAVVLNMGVAESIARRFRNRGESFDDLMQVAYFGLTKAVRGFDPTKGDEFLDYAVPTISGEVKRHFRDAAWAVRPPRRIQELQSAISRTAADLNQELGRPPRPSELAERLKVPTDDISEALACDGCFTPNSLDERGPNDEGFAVVDMLGDYDHGFDRAEVVALLRPACRTLKPRDQHVLFLRFFRGWTQTEIAAELCTTQMQVSRLLARILATLRQQVADTEPLATASCGH